MKTTVEIKDELFRRAKAEAALRGIKLKDLIEESLSYSLSKSRETSESQPVVTAWDVMKDACGIFDSGTTDLASNPIHLEGLGRDSMGNR